MVSIVSTILKSITKEEREEFRAASKASLMEDTSSASSEFLKLIVS